MKSKNSTLSETFGAEWGRLDWDSDHAGGRIDRRLLPGYRERMLQADPTARPHVPRPLRMPVHQPFSCHNGRRGTGNPKHHTN